MLANQSQHIFINLIFHRHKRHPHIHEPDCQNKKTVRDFQLNMVDKLDVFVSPFLEIPPKEIGTNFKGR